MPEVSLDDNPLLLELQSLRASVAQFQEEAHVSAVKLQRHSLDVARSHERAVQLERENDVFRSELALLRANPHPNAQSSPVESQRQVQELTLSLRRLSHKLSLTEEALLAKNTELLTAQAQTAKAVTNADSAYELGARVRGREEEGLLRKRDLELRIRKLEEQLKMSDVVVQEYAALVREMEAARLSSEAEKPRGSASSLRDNKLSLDHLFSEFKAESGELHDKLDKITAELEVRKAELDAEKKIHQTLLDQLGHSRTELQKLQLEDATAAKMVSRYMQFSQTSTNNLLTTLNTLQTRHSATVSALTSQNHILSTQLRSLESQNERLRSALDELGGEIMKETYGRRREVALRIKMGGREERVVEGLRRWVRRGDELLGRVRRTDDEERAPAAQLDALLDMAQHARILLENIDEGLLDEQSALSLSSGKARALVVQFGLQGLLDELKEQTARRVELEKQVADMRDAGMLDSHTSGNGYVDEPPQVPEKTPHLDTTPLPAESQHPPPVAENGHANPLPPEPTTEASHTSGAAEGSALGQSYDLEARVAEVVPVTADETSPNEHHDTNLYQEFSDAPPTADVTGLPDLSSSSTAPFVKAVHGNVTIDNLPPVLSGNDRAQSSKSKLDSPKPIPPTLVEPEVIEVVPADTHSLEPEDAQNSSAPALDDSPPATLPDDQHQLSNVDSLKPTLLTLVETEVIETAPLDTPNIESEPVQISTVLSASSADPEQASSTSLPPTSSEINDSLTNSVSLPSSSTSTLSSTLPIPPATSPTTPISEPETKEETKPPAPNPLLAELARVSKRYDDLQRAFRDCHLALEGLKASLGSTTPYGYQSSSTSLTTLATPTPLSNSSTIPSDVLRAALGRLDDYTEDARVELEIRIGDEALLAKGYETLLSVPGVLVPAEKKQHPMTINGNNNGAKVAEDDHEPTLSDVEHQIEGFVSGTDPAVRKTRDAFTRKLEDVQHDIAALKMAIHDPESLEQHIDQSSDPLSAGVHPASSSASNLMSPSENNNNNTGGWSSWIRGPPSRSSSPAPTPQSSTFGAIMTSPRLRHSPSTGSFHQSQGQSQRPRKASFFGFGGSSEPVKDPLAPLGLKVPMPSFGVNVGGGLGSASLGGFGAGGGYGLISPTSPMAPATRSRTVSSTMYMLGLGSTGAGGPGKMVRSVSGGAPGSTLPIRLSWQSSTLYLSTSSTHSRHTEESGVSEEVVEMTEDEGENEEGDDVE